MFKQFRSRLLSRALQKASEVGLSPSIALLLAHAAQVRTSSGSSSAASGGGDAARTPGDGAAEYTVPKHRGKLALSQKVKFLDRLIVEVAGGKGGGGSAALFGRSGG